MYRDMSSCDIMQHILMVLKWLQDGLLYDGADCTMGPLISFHFGTSILGQLPYETATFPWSPPRSVVYSTSGMPRACVPLRRPLHTAICLNIYIYM